MRVGGALIAGATKSTGCATAQLWEQCRVLRNQRSEFVLHEATLPPGPFEIQPFDTKGSGASQFTFRRSMSASIHGCHFGEN